MRSSTRHVLSATWVVLLAACGGAGGGGSSGWPYRVRVDEVSTPAPALRALGAHVVVGENDVLSVPGLAFLDDGTPVVGYFAPTLWGPDVYNGELLAATVRGDVVSVATMHDPGTQHWSRLSGAPGRLAYIDAMRTGAGPTAVVDWGFFAGTAQGATPQATIHTTYPDAFLRAYGRPVLSAGNVLVAPMVANLTIGGATRLALWREGTGWDMSDVITTETDPDHHRLQWGNGCEPMVTFDGNAEPVVAYEANVVHLTNPGVETDTHEFWVARKQGGLWTTEQVFSIPYSPGTSGGADRGPFVAVSVTGDLHLAVLADGAVYHAVRPAGATTWEVETVPLDLNADSDLGFALDHDVPSILFSSASAGAALASLEGGTWRTESIDPAGYVSNGTLAVDRDGLLWAVYDTPSPNGYYLNLAHARPSPQDYPAYFSIDGKRQFVASRNVSGRSVAEIETLLDKAAAEGTKVVRFHVTHLGGLGISADGGVVEAWAADWDAVFAYARSKGLHVIPVFGVWADWNDGSNGEAWHVWDQNPLRGLATSPLELYTGGSAVQNAWLGWVRTLVTRWQANDHVIAWESFSELDLVTRGTLDDATFQARGIAFAERAASVIRAADPSRRPVTASTGPWQRWFPALYASSAVDLAQIHLYSPGADLDAQMLDAIRALRLQGFGKPILVGESGLDWAAPNGSTATTAPQHDRATRHAVWAELVSGAMNGRALWWEDGYDILQNGDAAAVTFVTTYPAVEAPALAVLAGRDLAGVRPISLTLPSVMLGGAIGDERRVLAWVRTAGCSLTSGWSCSTGWGSVLVTFQVPGTAPTWQVTFYDAATGAARGAPTTVARSGSAVQVALPTFTDDIAVELDAVMP